MTETVVIITPRIVDRPQDTLAAAGPTAREAAEERTAVPAR